MLNSLKFKFLCLKFQHTKRMTNLRKQIGLQAALAFISLIDDHLRVGILDREQSIRYFRPQNNDVIPSCYSLIKTIWPFKLSEVFCFILPGCWGMVGYNNICLWSELCWSGRSWIAIDLLQFINLFTFSSYISMPRSQQDTNKYIGDYCCSYHVSTIQPNKYKQIKVFLTTSWGLIPIKLKEILNYNAVELKVRC